MHILCCVSMVWMIFPLDQMHHTEATHATISESLLQRQYEQNLHYPITSLTLHYFHVVVEPLECCLLDHETHRLHWTQSSVNSWACFHQKVFWTQAQDWIVGQSLLLMAASKDLVHPNGSTTSPYCGILCRESLCAFRASGERWQSLRTPGDAWCPHWIPVREVNMRLWSRDMGVS